jgi:hypothetical protein
MIATSGDEAFVMLARFPGTALLLSILLSLAGIIFAWLGAVNHNSQQRRYIYPKGRQLCK